MSPIRDRMRSMNASFFTTIGWCCNMPTEVMMSLVGFLTIAAGLIRMVLALRLRMVKEHTAFTSDDAIEMKLSGSEVMFHEGG